MPEPTDNLVETQDGKRTSSATRRIVVKDQPPAEPPRAQGRKLSAPTSSDQSQERTYDRGPRFSSASASQPATGRRLSGASGSAARQADGGATYKKTAKRSDSKPGQVNVRKLLLISGGMVGFVFLVTVVLLLISSGNRQQRGAPGAQATPTAPAVAVISPAPQSVSTVQPAAEASPVLGKPPLLELSEIKELSERLASQISGKGGYSFSQQFLEQVSSRTHEYSSEKAFAAAQQYRREINKSFHDEGVAPLIGYALAMSRSKFDANMDDKGLGLWQIPPAVARAQGYLDSEDSTAKLRSPEASAQIAAAYTKALLLTFDAEDFMYGVACFGLSVQDAGLLRVRLNEALPNEQSRRDVSMISKSNVLTGEQVENIARFFAAGIVGQNPQKFGLKDAKPFYSLY